MAQSQCIEISSVLIAVNSYAQAGDQLPTLPYARQVLRGYVDTFQHLLFKVECLFDYTLEAFNIKFAEFCEKSVGDHVVVILYGHGGIFNGIECQHTFSARLSIPHLESTFAEKCRYKNRYLLLDICRITEEGACAPNWVYQANTQGGTYIVHSTLTFHPAERNMWSRLLAQNLRDVDATLDKVIDSVDGQIKLLHPGLQQVSHTQSKGSHGAPNFKQLANFKNFSVPSSENLRQPVDKADNYMAAIQPPHNPVMASFGSLAPSNPSNQQRPTDNDQLLSEAALGNPNQPSAQGQQYMADQPRADREMGAVLIAVNSYRHNSKLFPLHYADRVLKGYIETFYRYLFFNVHVVVDFTGKDFKSNLNEFTTWCQQHEMTRIAVVFYGHGGIVKGKECVFTDIGEPLAIADLEVALHSRCPKDNKYLFIDACRELQSGPKIVPDSYVFQTNTDCTTVIRSTLLFKRAYSNAWSECFAMSLRNHGTLVDIVNTVDDRMKHSVGDYQKSDMVFRGALDSPNFRGAAVANNNAEGIRKLSTYLQERIKVVEQNFEALRHQLKCPPKPIMAFPDSPPDSPSNQPAPAQLGLPIAQEFTSGPEHSKTLCDNPHIQSFKKHVMNRYKRMKPSESRVRVEYVQLALLEAQPYTHNEDEEEMMKHKKGGGNKVDFMESFRSCGLSGKDQGLVDIADLLKPTSDADYRMKVVYGQAGIGKTTMLTHICRSLTLDKPMQSSYALVLYFPLGVEKVSSAEKLRDLLSYYTLVKSLSEAVEQALDDSGGKEVLIIFDGADEVQDLLSSGVCQELLEGLALPLADVIVSSRPGGLPHLMKQKVPIIYEILGLSKLSIQNYIKEFFKSSPEKGERLWKELQDRDDLMGGAHIPMNLLIFCNIFGKGGGLPPTLTLTDCYKQFIVDVHKRESPEKKWRYFDECPKDVEQLLLSLGRLAYNGLMSTPSTFVFEEKDVEKAFRVKTTSLDKIKPTFKGLLHEHPSISDAYSHISIFEFSHTTQQELFCAYYISHLPVGEQIEFLKGNCSNRKFSMVLRFYAGLTGLVDEQVVHTVLHEPGFFRYPFMPKASTTGQSICALDYLRCDNDNPGLLHLFHFLYESQNSELTLSVARHLDGKSIKFSYFLTSYDTRVIAYCLRESHSFSHLTFDQGRTADSEHVLSCASLILKSDSVAQIQKLTFSVNRLTLTGDFLLKEGLARTAVDVMRLNVNSADMSAIAAVFEAPGLKTLELIVMTLCPDSVSESDLELAQSTARNSRIKELEVFSLSSLLLLSVLKGLAANTCVEKLVLGSHQFGDGDDGGVAQALAKTCTTNTTLKDIELNGVSPFPLTEVLCNREVPLQRLAITWNKDYSDSDLEVAQSSVRNTRIKELKVHISKLVPSCLRVVKGLAYNTYVEKLDLEYTGRGGDGGVGQALATACTTNTTLKDIQLRGVSPIPLMKVLGSREVPLERLAIEWDDNYYRGSDLEVAQSSARNTRIKKLKIHTYLQPSLLLLSVVKGLAANTCVEKFDLDSGLRGDGGVGQALATAYTTNTTLKDIELCGVSPVPLMKVLCSLEVLLERLRITWYPDSVSDSDIEVAQSTARNSRIKELNVQSHPSLLLPVVKGLAANACAEKLALYIIDRSGDGDDGGVGQALATACTTNTTMKDIQLWGVSPVPLMKVLCSREVPLERLAILWYPGSDSDSDLEVAQSTARNTRIKELGIYSQPSLLLPVVKGLATNTCLEKLFLRSNFEGSGGDGGVGQALATTCTTNTTLKDIELRSVSPVPLMEVLCSREVPLERLSIIWDSLSTDLSPCTPEALETLSQNMKVKRFKRSDLRGYRTEQLQALIDGLSRNKSLKEVDLTLRWGVPADVKDYISAKLSTLETVKIHYR